jgi:hypothetical protein
MAAMKQVRADLRNRRLSVIVNAGSNWRRLAQVAKNTA